LSKNPFAQSQIISAASVVDRQIASQEDSSRAAVQKILLRVVRVNTGIATMTWHVLALDKSGQTPRSALGLRVAPELLTCVVSEMNPMYSDLVVILSLAVAVPAAALIVFRWIAKPKRRHRRPVQNFERVLNSARAVNFNSNLLNPLAASNLTLDRFVGGVRIPVPNA
jgi:hypothetical protein